MPDGDNLAPEVEQKNRGQVFSGFQAFNPSPSTVSKRTDILCG